MDDVDRTHLDEAREILTYGHDGDRLDAVAHYLGRSDPSHGDAMIGLQCVLIDAAVEADVLPWTLTTADVPEVDLVLLEEIHDHVPGLLTRDGDRWGLTPLGWRVAARVL